MAKKQACCYLFPSQSLELLVIYTLPIS